MIHSFVKKIYQRVLCEIFNCFPAFLVYFFEYYMCNIFHDKIQEFLLVLINIHN